MSLTSDMKDELARAVITTPSEVAAEVSATLRFAGGLHLVGGRILWVSGKYAKVVSA